MFRIFCQAPLISSYQSLLFPSVVPSSSAAVTFFSGPSYHDGSHRKVTSSVVGPKLLLEQSRNYWTKEGRPGWRIRQAKERQRRLPILNPNTPVIDDQFPLPEDNRDRIPPGLFEEEPEQLSPEEERRTQNEIVERINQQVKDNSEGRLFAVVQINSRQFKVTPEDLIVVQEYFPPDVGDQIRLHKVLLVGGKDFTLLGSPLLDQDFVRIEATVVEKMLSYTKLVFFMKKRKNFRRYKFQKPQFTILRINMIKLMQPLEAITSDAQKFSHQQQFI